MGASFAWSRPAKLQIGLSPFVFLGAGRVARLSHFNRKSLNTAFADRANGDFRTHTPRLRPVPAAAGAPAFFLFLGSGPGACRTTPPRTSGRSGELPGPLGPPSRGNLSRIHCMLDSPLLSGSACPGIISLSEFLRR